VHCALGYSRSALAIAAWRALQGDDPVGVIEHLRAHRAIVISPAARQALAGIARKQVTPGALDMPRTAPRVGQ